LTQTTPTLRRRSRMRNDTRSLLRSRPLQAALALVAGIQVMAVGSGNALHRQEPRSVRELAESTTALRDVPMVAVSAPVTALTPRLALKASARRTGSKHAAAEEFAVKYRQRGFKLSPALASQIHAAAVANHIDPRVAFGLVRTESGFKSSATSPVGAIGLTQLMPATARLFQHGITRSDLRNPEVNLRIGFRYLRELIDKYEGDTELALTAYNRGPGTVDRVLKRGGDPDNGYAGMVLGRRRQK
jgi:soluble lytic murein transglycosylase-like protein